MPLLQTTAQNRMTEPLFACQKEPKVPRAGNMNIQKEMLIFNMQLNQVTHKQFFDKKPV